MTTISYLNRSVDDQDLFYWSSVKHHIFSISDILHFSVTQHVADNTMLSGLRIRFAWWRHQMETFSALLALCAGKSSVTSEFPTQRPVTRSFDVFFDLRLNKRLSKQSWSWWFETPSRSLWRHCNVRKSMLSITTCPQEADHYIELRIANSMI